MPIALYSLLHRLGRRMLPDCLWGGDAAVSTVALTFDDGPHPEYTPALLDVLAAHRTQATFFLLGERVARYPGVVRRIHEAGHGIGLHGYDHRLFPLLGARALRISLEATRAQIGDTCGIVADSVRDVRPPGGVATPNTVAQLREWGYRPVMWSVVAEDWARPGVPVVVARTLAQVRPGSLIALHDGRHGGQDAAAVVNALLPALRERGYDCVTVAALAEKQGRF